LITTLGVAGQQKLGTPVKLGDNSKILLILLLNRYRKPLLEFLGENALSRET
jgi:hypothetical protein